MSGTHVHTINVNGVEIFYREAGKANAPVVLLLHGFPSSSFQYRNLITKLEGKYRVIVRRISIIHAGVNLHTTNHRRLIFLVLVSPVCNLSSESWLGGWLYHELVINRGSRCSQVPVHVWQHCKNDWGICRCLELEKICSIHLRLRCTNGIEVRLFCFQSLFFISIPRSYTFRLALSRPSAITAIISQNGNAFEVGLGEFWNGIRKYWNDPTG